jgi:antirestriction protein ArdC
MTTQALTPNKRQELIDQLRQGIESVSDSERFKEYLRFSASFHAYSLHNRILIWLQKPDATQVAGFHTWLKLGRYVRKGEKGIAIFAPCAYPAKNDDEEARIFFKVVYVFDISQTDGNDVPSLTSALHGNASALVDGLLTVAASEGVTVSREAEEGQQANGYYSRSRKLIWLSPSITETAQLAQTLAHELSHHFADEECTRAEGEIIADSAAYIVLGHHGIEAGDFSFDYVAVWASRTERGAFEKKLTTVHKVADRILQGLSAEAEALPLAA